jgi:hypothetical protein
MEVSMTRFAPDAAMLAGAFALIGAIVAFPLWR